MKYISFYRTQELKYKVFHELKNVQKIQAQKYAKIRFVKK